MSVEGVDERLQALEVALLGSGGGGVVAVRSSSLLEEVQSIKTEMQRVTLTSAESVEKVRESFQLSQTLAKALEEEGTLSLESKAQTLVDSRGAIEDRVEGLQNIQQLEHFANGEDLSKLTPNTLERIENIKREQQVKRSSIDIATKSIQDIMVNYEAMMNTISDAFVQLDARIRKVEDKVKERTVHDTTVT